MSEPGKVQSQYLMEHEDEGERLHLKTDKEAVIRQATWAGIKPGMRVLDAGCGVGATTAALAELVGEQGSVVGLDFSAERLTAAREKFGSEKTSFVQHDIREPYLAPEPFDAVWSRFFIEYFRQDQGRVIANCVASLRPGGLACFADLDNNSLGHYGLSMRLEKTLEDIAANLEKNFDFDPYAGRRLYGHLYELGFQDIACTGELHHLGYGQAGKTDQFNWLQKLEVVAQKSGCTFSEYAGDFEGFRKEFMEFLNSPFRFTYSPLIIVRGIKGAHAR